MNLSLQVCSTSSKIVSMMELVIVFVLVTGLSAYFSVLDPDLHHDGFMLKTATDVASGDTLFKDTFTQYGAFTVWTQSAAISLFGTKLVVLRLFTAGCYGLIACIFFGIQKKVLPKLLAILSMAVLVSLAPFYVMPLLPWSSVYALLFLLLGIYSFLVGLKTKKLYLILISGAAFACCFWYRQPTGIVLITTYLYFIVTYWDTRTPRVLTFKRFFAFSGGAVAVNILVVTLLIVAGSLGDWWKQSILGPYLWVNSFGDESLSFMDIMTHLVAPNLVWAGVGSVSYIWTVYPTVTVIWGIIVITKILKQRALNLKEHYVLIIVLASIGSWHQYYPLTDMRHVYWASAPMMGLLVLSLSCLTTKLRCGKLLSVAMTTIVLVGFFWEELEYRFREGSNRIERIALGTSNLEGMFLTKPYFKALGREGTIQEYSMEITQIANFLKNVREYDETIQLVNLTYDMYSLTELHGKNYHKVYLSWPWAGMLYPDHDVALRTYILKNRPLLEVPKNSFWSDEGHPIRAKFGVSNYYVVAESNYGLDGTIQILAPQEFMENYLPTYM